MEYENQRNCPRCGAPAGSAQGFCGNCGMPLGSAWSETRQIPEIRSEKDFFKAYASKNTKTLYTLQIVLCFLSAALALANTFLVSPLCLIDLAFCGITGIAMRINKNRIFPILIFAYSSIATLMSLVNHGILTGVFALIIAGLLIRSMNKLHRAYQDYLETGARPAFPL